jgi:uncharacterized protein
MGILIMNMPGFSSSFFAEADGSHLWSGQVDQMAEHVREALFSGKFNSMFSLLFGIGFTIQFQRIQQRDPAHATGLYLRRLLALLAFGVIHAVVFWPGDVLHNYAILGIVLVLGLRHVSDRGIVALIVACLLYPALNGMLRVAVMAREMVAERVRLEQALDAADQIAYGQGSFWDMVQQNARAMAYFYGDWLSLWGAFGWYVMLGMTMLIGVLAGRRRWVQRADELMPQIRRLMWWTLTVGLACGVAFTVIFELKPRARPVADQGAGQRLLRPRAGVVDAVLRAAHRAAGPHRAGPALAPALGAGRADAAHQLPDADGDLHHAVPALGFRSVDEGRPGRRFGAVVGDLLPGAGTVERMVAEASRARADGGPVGMADLRARAADGRRDEDCAGLTM